jgi:hypothetical protein
MASIKETRILNLSVNVAIDEFDQRKLTAVVEASTATSEGRTVFTVREDVSSLLQEEDIDTLQPLVQRVYQRLMEVRQITPGDLAEGAAAVQQQHEQRQAVRAQDADDGLPEPIDPVQLRKNHLESLKDFQAEQDRIATEAERTARIIAEEQQAAHERALRDHEAEVERLQAEDRAYQKHVAEMQANQRKVVEERRKLEERDKQEAEQRGEAPKQRSERPSRPTR